MAHAFESVVFYRCSHCGNVVAKVIDQGHPLVCCGEPMKLLREGATDGATEKHVPVIEKTENGYKVKVGSAPHPMAEDHYIEWIELLADGVSHIAFLNPGDAPEAAFCVKADTVVAREFCNKHGLWKAEFQG